MCLTSSLTDHSVLVYCGLNENRFLFATYLVVCGVCTPGALGKTTRKKRKKNVAVHSLESSSLSSACEAKHMDNDDNDDDGDETLLVKWDQTRAVVCCSIIEISLECLKNYLFVAKEQEECQHWTENGR